MRILEMRLFGITGLETSRRTNFSHKNLSRLCLPPDIGEFGTVKSTAVLLYQSGKTTVSNCVSRFTKLRFFGVSSP
jgi:hypothetical protein